MKGKVHNIPGLEYLYQRIPPDQLDLPDFILDYDLRVCLFYINLPKNILPIPPSVECLSSVHGVPLDEHTLDTVGLVV